MFLVGMGVGIAIGMLFALGAVMVEHFGEDLDAGDGYLVEDER